MPYRSAEARNASACLQIALLPSSLPSVAFRGVGNDILVEEGTFSSSRYSRLLSLPFTHPRGFTVRISHKFCCYNTASSFAESTVALLCSMD